MKPCVHCSELIQPTASKCPSCQTFQNWRRHLAIGVSFTTILIALITAGSFAYRPFITFISPEKGIRVSYVGANESSYFIFVENIGRQPAVFDHAVAFYPDQSVDPNQEFGVLNHTLLGAKFQDFVIEPQTAKTMALHVKFPHDYEADGQLMPDGYILEGKQSCHSDIKFTMANEELFFRLSHDLPYSDGALLCDATYINFLEGITALG